MPPEPMPSSALLWVYREVTVEHGGKWRLPEVLMHWRRF